jgi:hypothetical protein
MSTGASGKGGGAGGVRLEVCCLQLPACCAAECRLPPLPPGAESDPQLHLSCVSGLDALRGWCGLDAWQRHSSMFVPGQAALSQRVYIGVACDQLAIYTPCVPVLPRRMFCGCCSGTALADFWQRRAHQILRAFVAVLLSEELLSRQSPLSGVGHREGVAVVCRV